MKHIIIYFLLTLLVNTSFSQDRSFRPKGIIFSRTDTCITQGPVSCDSLTVWKNRDLFGKMKSILGELVGDENSIFPVSDSLANGLVKGLQTVFEEIPKLKNQEINIQTRSDTIFRHYSAPIQGGNLFERIDESGKIYNLTGKDSTTVNIAYDLFNTHTKYETSVSKSDQKIILGIVCYKITITEKETIHTDVPFEFGDIVYEMYVTDTISLPLHSLIPIHKQFPGFFPLEIKQWYTKSPEFLTLYKVKQIVK